MSKAHEVIKVREIAVEQSPRSKVQEILVVSIFTVIWIHYDK